MEPRATASTDAVGNAPAVSMLYHPTVAVSDLEAARAWYRRVFARDDYRWADAFDLSSLAPDYPIDYSFYAFVADLHIVFLSPKLLTRGALQGQDRYDGISDRLAGTSWYTDDAAALCEHLAELGIRTHDQKQRLVTAGTPPVSSLASDFYVAFTYPEDVAFRYEFAEIGSRHRAKYAKHADPRLDDPRYRQPAADDPLRLIGASHHTFLTSDPRAAEHLLVDALGGAIVGRRANAELGGTSTFIQVGKDLFEYVALQPGSPLAGRVAAGRDDYYGIGFITDDITAATEHLRAIGVGYESRDDDVIVIEPENGFGAEWRFSQRPPI